MLFDLMMQPIDSYWKKRFHAEEIKRRAAEADATCYRYRSQDLEEKVNVLSERDIGQYHAIEVLNRKIAELQQSLEQKDKDLQTAHELLAAERRASKAYALSEKLWEERKERVSSNAADIRSEATS